MAVALVANVLASDQMAKKGKAIICEEGEIVAKITNLTNFDYEIYLGCDRSTIGAYMGIWQVSDLVERGEKEWQFTAFNGYFRFNKTHQICILFDKKNKTGTKFSIYGGTAQKIKNPHVEVRDDGIVMLNGFNHAKFNPMNIDMIKEFYYYKLKLETLTHN